MIDLRSVPAAPEMPPLLATESSIARLEHRLRVAARLEAMTRDRVRAYCAAIGERDHRLEAAILRTALDTILYWRRLRDWLIWSAGLPAR